MPGGRIGVGEAIRPFHVIEQVVHRDVVGGGYRRDLLAARPGLKPNCSIAHATDDRVCWKTVKLPIIGHPQRFSFPRADVNSR